jgi:hypothetical protein
MKYKAVMAMNGKCPTYWGNTIEEALLKAQDDCWIREDIHEGWIFADPEEDWKKYAFSNFVVYDMENKTAVMCLWNPCLTFISEGE